MSNRADRDRFRRAQEKDFFSVWRTSNGTQMLVTEMETGHLRNTVAYLKRKRAGENEGWIISMEAELEKRGAKKGDGMKLFRGYVLKHSTLKNVNTETGEVTDLGGRETTVVIDMKSVLAKSREDAADVLRSEAMKLTNAESAVEKNGVFVALFNRDELEVHVADASCM